MKNFQKRLWIVWSNSIVELAQFHRRSPVTLLQRNKQLACNPFYKMCHQQISCWSKIAWLFPLGEGRIRYITYNFYSYSNSKRHWRWFCGLWKKSWLPTWSGLWGQICQPPCVLTGWGWSKPNLRGKNVRNNNMSGVPRFESKIWVKKHFQRSLVSRV